MNASKRFGPLDITDFRALVGRNINVTLSTAAVRGRIECTPYETPSNPSNWLQSGDLQDTYFWNAPVNPEDPARGYELLRVIGLSPEMNTTTFASSARLTCCADGTNKEPRLGSIGYWSKNSNQNEDDNFTVKWIVRRPSPSSLSIWRIDLTSFVRTNFNVRAQLHSQSLTQHKQALR